MNELYYLNSSLKNINKTINYWMKEVWKKDAMEIQYVVLEAPCIFHWKIIKYRF